MTYSFNELPNFVKAEFMDIAAKYNPKFALSCIQQKYGIIIIV